MCCYRLRCTIRGVSVKTVTNQLQQVCVGCVAESYLCRREVGCAVTAYGHSNLSAEDVRLCFHSASRQQAVRVDPVGLIRQR